MPVARRRARWTATSPLPLGARDRSGRPAADGRARSSGRGSGACGRFQVGRQRASQGRTAQRRRCGVARGSKASVTAMASPPRSLADGSLAATESTVTRPASIQPLMRLRECCGSNCASAWSSRRPAAPCGTIKAWCNGAVSRVEILIRLSVIIAGMPMRESIVSWRVVFAGVLLALALASCSWLPQVGKDETAGWPADQLYREARQALLQGNYTRAGKLFETLEAR